MRIGELARQAGTAIETIRYYEKVGLLPPPPRRANGYRAYSAPHLERLAFVRHCRALDMSLDDIRQLLNLVTDPDADCSMANRLVDDRLARVRRQIADLRELEQQLQTLRTQCPGEASVSQCGIVQELVSAAHNDGCVCHGQRGTGDDA